MKENFQSLAVEEVIRQNRGLLYYIIRPIVKDENLMEDCFSTVCEVIIKNYEKYDPRLGSLTTWLTRVARNASINFIKNRNHAILASSEEPQTETAIDFDTPESILLRKEQMEELKKALTCLDRTETNIFLRKYYYLQSTQQIGAELGLSQRAVEGRLYRIKKKLLKKLGGVSHDEI
ncbi:MAG: sigma-70 family RNA polymerase sigma factor [Firmicutes bacterium]|jgi:RNA polymerase sigma factor (sigma-70 family)|nr:sigma-70 family RNA polymerase sigma factor [Bacillota bacterium]